MFSPSHASEEIRRSFTDYIATSYHIADPDYRASFRNALDKAGFTTKGPFLDIGGSYETARSLADLIQDGIASPLFQDLEPVPEERRELKILRPLYLHQEQAFRMASAGKNLVVTTGTGSGKTECFLIPVIDALLREREAGTLDAGVRAIIIYPMNALANDQIKRMRAIFRQYPAIRFGVYNGNTRHIQTDALRDYRRTHRDAGGREVDPLPNEVISREIMQMEPPHILITNYSMLEYMMLRPRDDAVFSGARLRYIILDEAHIYKGATGIETAMLMRRLRARISEPDSVQYILTSATLGGPDANEAIRAFAERLCGVRFTTDCIIRSAERRPQMEELRDWPPELFSELSAQPRQTEEILARYRADFAPGGTAGEKLYALFLHSRLFAVLRQSAAEPVTMTELCRAFRKVCPEIREEQVVDFVSVCARAERDGAALIRPRYHFFARALEGAYITLKEPKRLFLQRENHITDPRTGDEAEVFEAAVCGDCGRLAIVGNAQSGHLVQCARRGREDGVDFYCLCREGDGSLADETEEDAGDGKRKKRQKPAEFRVCSICGAISSSVDLEFEKACEHGLENYVRIHQAQKRASGGCTCPACGHGTFNRFYLGNEAATSVLGMELFEQLPAEEVTTRVTASGRGGMFARGKRTQTTRTRLMRQFLCFSDSRSEAAFFASYMERSYQEFIRRRGIWHLAERYRKSGRATVGMQEFIEELVRMFDSRHSFSDWEDTQTDPGLLSVLSRKNAWIAVLNEMFSARRSTSLVAMGCISFEYIPNDDVQEILSDSYGISPEESRALLELMVQDAVFVGAINAGRRFSLTDPDREYIFYTPTPQRLVPVRTQAMTKKSYLHGWCGRKRPNGSYYANLRLSRLTQALGISPDEADGILRDYWDGVFQPEEADYALDANDFRIRIGGTPGSRFWRCTRCGKTTPFNVGNRCATVRCGGTLVEADPLKESGSNHYARLYASEQMEPLYIREHTAQLAKDQQTKYQEAFVNKKIHALSCSTTFEMGVDLGSLETVFLRDIPPSPANYVQRAGRAGRGAGSAAFVLTYSRLSSHDFSYYADPAPMIRGQIQAPVFELENEKILARHVYAVVMSSFFAAHEEIYDGDNASAFLNEDGYEIFRAYLADMPEHLRSLLRRSIPESMQERLGIRDGSWVERLIGEDGVLEVAVQDFRGTVAEMIRARDDCRQKGDDSGAARWSGALRAFRCSKEDGNGKKSLISFLVRNNVLPKYGFPVDTVEMLPDYRYASRDNAVQLTRDLQVAIAEYAPGAQVIADNRMYTSRYIRKMPGREWEFGSYCPVCPTCQHPNFSRSPVTGNGRECISCHQVIGPRHWRRTLEPRMGFCAEDPNGKEVPLSRPRRDYHTEDAYIGDPQRRRIQMHTFQVNGMRMEIESTSNDSLVVVGQKNYAICPVCGYAAEDAKGVPLKHKDSRGYWCRNQEGRSYNSLLSHDFKTDVAKITFHTAEAMDFEVMISVLYALLEGLSREMGIERTDIKGCLFGSVADGFMVQTVVLYDAVAGGAGHVRRIVTKDGAAFQRVLRRALSVVDTCTCGSSCYSCLRNYYNQKLHDILDRTAASRFLHMWEGEMTLDDEETAEADADMPEPALV